MTTLTGQDIGRAHHATRAVLERTLAGTGLPFPAWVTLNAAAGTPQPERGVTAQVVRGLKIDATEVEAQLGELQGRGLIRRGDPVTLTPAGADLHTRIGAEIRAITRRLYGDIPADDLDTAHRVLATVTDRADDLLTASRSGGRSGAHRG